MSDGERIEWLQAQLPPDNGVELEYTPLDGFTVSLMEHNGATCWLSVRGRSLAEAIDIAIAHQRAIRPDKPHGNV